MSRDSWPRETDRRCALFPPCFSGAAVLLPAPPPPRINDRALGAKQNPRKPGGQAGPPLVTAPCDRLRRGGLKRAGRLGACGGFAARGQRARLQGAAAAVPRADARALPVAASRCTVLSVRVSHRPGVDFESGPDASSAAIASRMPPESGRGRHDADYDATPGRGSRGSRLAPANVL
jgi:hypothetical protein